jgi:RHS repeat-associated protein
VFLYDESGHLLGEYDGAGNAIQEIVWLGDIPVATVRQEACGLSIFYIHTDHLNTPRRITRRSTSDVVWSWDSDPFGTTVANENPSGLGSFSFNLRFPGQYADAETGLNYNYHRDYDSATGRYVESDPIGLHGGINTYADVGGNPVSYTDPLGLAIGDFPPAPPGYNPWTWNQGQWPNGKDWLQDPDGNRYTIHPEDASHWRHWDKQDRNGKDGGQCPGSSGKPWPGQKKLKSNQSATDPNGDAPPWTPDQDFSQLPQVPLPVVPITPLAPVPLTPPPTVRPFYEPFFEPFIP